MAKFKIGDKFKVIGGTLDGVITDIVYNIANHGDDYVVAWNSNFPYGTPNSFNYPADQAESLWELEYPLVREGSYSDIQRSYRATTIDIKECQHKWVEVGFNLTKIVCFHCNKEFSDKT